MSDRKGQFGVYLKPILILILAILFVFLIATVLDYQTNLKEQESDVQFNQQVRKNAQKVIECVSFNSSLTDAGYIMNQSKLIRYEMDYQYREPPCAADYRYGFNITVKQDFPQPLDSELNRSPTDIVFAIDDSHSMGPYIEQVNSYIDDFTATLPEGSRLGMFTHSTECDCHGGEYIDHVVELTENHDQVNSMMDTVATKSKPGGREAEDIAIQYAMNEFDWKDQHRKFIIIVSDEAAHEDYATTDPPQEGGPGLFHVIQGLADQARAEDIRIFTWAEEDHEEEYKDIARRTYGQYHRLNSEFQAIFRQITRNPDVRIGQTTCTVPRLRREGDGDVVNEEIVTEVRGKSTRCENQKFRFGQRRASEGKSLDNNILLKLPVSIHHSDFLTTSGTLTIEQRSGDAETLVGAINRVVDKAQEKDTRIQQEIRFSNEQRIFAEHRGVTKRVKTRYKLTSDGNDQVDVNDELVVGVNGHEVARGEGGIDFSNDDNHFMAYEGATLQVIGVNFEEDEMRMPSVTLECVTGCPTDQQIVTNPVQASPGDTLYEDLGGIGIFFHNFATIDIGQREDFGREAVCINAPSGENCIVLDNEDINDITEFELRPGEHLLQIEYDPDDKEVIVRE